jgi:hypothetical protein
MKWQDDVHDSTPGRDKVSSAVSSFEQNQFCESLPPPPPHSIAHCTVKGMKTWV